MAEVIRFDVSDALKGLDEINSSFRRAISRGLNKTAANVRTAASVAIRQRRKLSARVVREAMGIKSATPSKLGASLTVTGKPIPLRDYAARQTKQGVTVAVSPGPRKLVVHRGNRAFILPSIGGHVFAREGKGRLPIKKLFGPSLPSTFIQAEVRRAWTATATEAMPKRIAEELRFELSKQRAQ